MRKWRANYCDDSQINCVVLHCHHNRTLIACNCFSAINQMFTVTSHILMMTAQAAPNTSPIGSLRSSAGWHVPRSGIKAMHRHWIKELPFSLCLEGSRLSGQSYSESWRCSSWDNVCTDPWPSSEASALMCLPAICDKYLDNPIICVISHCQQIPWKCKHTKQWPQEPKNENEKVSKIAVPLMVTWGWLQKQVNPHRLPC